MIAAGFSAKTKSTNLHEVEIDFNDIHFSVKDVIHTLGYNEDNIPEHFLELINQIIKKQPQLCSIKSGFRILPVNPNVKSKDGLLIGDVFLNLDRIITSQLRLSEMVGIFVCTIGNKMEKWAAQLVENGDSVSGFFVNNVASVTVEAVADRLHSTIAEIAKNENNNITNRYSPGYCDWNVAEQRKLFNFLPYNFCDISLNDLNMMYPVKSISGIIGIGPKVKYRDYLCSRCHNNNCIYRTKNKTKIKIN